MYVAGALRRLELLDARTWRDPYIAKTAYRLASDIRMGIEKWGVVEVEVGFGHAPVLSHQGLQYGLLAGGKRQELAAGGTTWQPATVTRLAHALCIHLFGGAWPRGDVDGPRHTRRHRWTTPPMRAPASMRMRSTAWAPTCTTLTTPTCRPCCRSHCSGTRGSTQRCERGNAGRSTVVALGELGQGQAQTCTTSTTPTCRPCCRCHCWATRGTTQRCGHGQADRSRVHARGRMHGPCPADGPGAQ